MFKKSQSNKVHTDCFLHEHRSEKTSVCKSDKHLQYQALSICILYIFCQLLNLQESSEWTSLFACRSRIACNNVHLHLQKFRGLWCNQSIYCRAMRKYIPCVNIHCTPTFCLFQYFHIADTWNFHQSHPFPSWWFGCKRHKCIKTHSEPIDSSFKVFMASNQCTSCLLWKHRWFWSGHILHIFTSHPVKRCHNFSIWCLLSDQVLG